MARNTLERAIAKQLFLYSKEVPDGDGGLMRAVALLLTGKPVDPALLQEAEKRLSNDISLYAPETYDLNLDLEAVWVAAGGQSD